MAADRLVANAIDHLTVALTAPHGWNLLTISNVILSVGSVFAAIAGVIVSRSALKSSREQSEAARQAVIISSKAITEQLRSERQSRNLQTLLHCQAAYKAIETERLKYKFGSNTDKIFISKGQVDSLFRNYWTLKSDQLDYWLSGHVDYDTFLSWNVSTLRHFLKSADEPFFVKSFNVGWAWYGRPYHVEMNPLFVRLTDAIQHLSLKIKEIDRRAIEDLLKIIGELVAINEKTDADGRTIRRYGAPDNFDSFCVDLTELHSNMKDLLSEFLPLHYDIAKYGQELRDKHPKGSDSLDEKIPVREATPRRKPGPRPNRGG